MTPAERVRWLWHWVLLAVRTIGYATLSLTLGPFTRGAASTWAARKWSEASARGLRISIQADGLENVPGNGFVFASNHQSLIDILVLGAALPGDFKWAAKRSLMNVPFLGWHLRLAGHVPVDRQKGRGAATGVAKAFERVLRGDKPLLVFPEGTLTHDGQVMPFKDGGFRAAVWADRPVVPVALEGTYALMSRGAVVAGILAAKGSGRLVSIQIGKALYPDHRLDEADRIADLRDRTQDAVVTMHSQLAAGH